MTADKQHPPSVEDRRRQNPQLRKQMDDLIQHVRAVSRGIEEMSSEELAEAQQRFHWFADVMWKSLLEQKRR